jgi:hypothetical protein
MCQYALRKYLARKKLNALRRVAACAVLLQAWARGRIALRTFTQRQRNIIVLQSVIRKRIVRKQYIATMRGKSMLCELLDKDATVDLIFDTSFLYVFSCGSLPTHRQRQYSSQKRYKD